MVNNIRLALPLAMCFCMILSVASATTFPQHISSYPQCYNMNGSMTKCVDGWQDDYLSSVYMNCWNNYTSNYITYCSGNCSSTTYPNMTCDNSMGMLTWYSGAYDGSHSTVYSYWCTDINSVVRSCSYPGCPCSNYTYCGDSNCSGWGTWGEVCGFDCSHELYCQDNSDNDEDGFIDTSDSDCPSCMQNETNCWDGKDNDCDGQTDGCDSSCIPGQNGYCYTSSEIGYCEDWINNDGDSQTDYCDSDCKLSSETGHCSDGRDNDCDNNYDGCDSDCIVGQNCYCSLAHETGSYCYDGVDNDCDSKVDQSDSDCPPIQCGNSYCEQGETYSSCPQDCCEAGCTAKSDNICHTECQGYYNCTMNIYCDSETSGVKVCSDSSSYVTCCSGQEVECGINKYCSDGLCKTCTVLCDGDCQSPSCANDPDCNTICGDGCCAPGESCIIDCGEECIFCDDYNPCTIDMCNSTTGFKCIHTEVTPCCGNDICEQSESSTNCPNDCPVEGQLLLRIISPRSNMSYNRGNVTQIRAQLNYGTQIVNNGEVNCVSPSGNSLGLAFELIIYSYDYTIPTSDPSGVWNLSCNASAYVNGQMRHDSDYIRIRVRDRLVIEPVDFEELYIQGQEIRVRVNVTYDNGTPAQGIMINITTPEGNITMNNTYGSMYEASYVVNQLGSINISFSASDLSGTTSYTGMSIASLKPLNPLEYIWLVPIIAIIGAGLMLGHKRYSVLMAKRGVEEKVTHMQQRMSEIEKETKALQKDYMQTRITEEQFRDRIRTLETESQRLDIEVKELKKQPKKQ